MTLLPTAVEAASIVPDTLPKTLNSAAAGFSGQLDALLAWDTGADGELTRSVTDVIAEVRARGDAAVIEYTNRFDRRSVERADQLRISADELRTALDGLPDVDREALLAAAARVRSYHEHQVDESWSYEDALGNTLGQQVTALRRVGVYVPGGQAAYPSTVLMTVIPARVAGVDAVSYTHLTLPTIYSV